MKLVPILVLTNGVALAMVIVLYFQQEDLRSQLGQVRAAPGRTVVVPGEDDSWGDERLRRLERELAALRGAPAVEVAARETAPDAPAAAAGAESGPVLGSDSVDEEAWELPKAQMEVFRKRVRLANELNREEERIEAVLETVDRLVEQNRIAPLDAKQKEKVAATILGTREKTFGIMRKLREDPSFRDLPSEERRTAVRAEFESVRTEALRSLEDVVPAADAKAIVDLLAQERAAAFGGRGPDRGGAPRGRAR